MILKMISNRNVFQQNSDKSLLINIQQINVMLKILKDKKKQYFMIKNKLHISSDKVTDTI